MKGGCLAQISGRKQCYSCQIQASLLLSRSIARGLCPGFKRWAKSLLKPKDEQPFQPLRMERTKVPEKDQLQAAWSAMLGTEGQAAEANAVLAAVQMAEPQDPTSPRSFDSSVQLGSAMSTKKLKRRLKRKVTDATTAGEQISGLPGSEPCTSNMLQNDISNS